jgi:hypothetical protein
MLVTKRGKKAALADVYRYRGMSPVNFPRVGTPSCDSRKAERSNDKREHGAFNSLHYYSRLENACPDSNLP